MFNSTYIFKNHFWETQVHIRNDNRVPPPKICKLCSLWLQMRKKEMGNPIFFFVAIVNYTITLGFFSCSSVYGSILDLVSWVAFLSQSFPFAGRHLISAFAICICPGAGTQEGFSYSKLLTIQELDTPPPQPGMQQEAIITGHERQGWEVSESVGSVLELQNFFLASFLFCVCLLRSLITIVGGTSISLSSEQRWHWSSRHFCSCLGQHGQELGN